MTSWLKRKCHCGGPAQTSDSAPGGFVLTSEAAKLEEEAAKLAKYAAVFDAAEAAGVRLAPSPPPGVHAYDSHPHFEGEGLRWPVVFCYPEAPAAQPDLLESVPGTDLLCDWLLTLFPEPGEGAGPDWDMKRVYRATEVSVYTRLP